MLTLTPALLVALAMMVGATHDAGCVYTHADPASILPFEVPADLDGDGNNELYYDEERGNPFGIPIPLTAYFFGPGCDGGGDCCSFLFDVFCGGGSWFYEETYQLPFLQRGGGGLTGDWFPPGCDENPDWEPGDATVPCLFIDEDPITDENCGHGPDDLIV